jgi:hypothetical protein
MEVRRAIAAIITRYDISLAPDQTEEAFLDGKIDAFTLVAAPLRLRFARRTNGNGDVTAHAASS